MGVNLETRKNKLMPNGIPRWIRCYDNGGDTADRYTVVFTGNWRRKNEMPCFPHRFMSTYPFSPQGVGMFGSENNAPIDTNDGKSWAPAIGRKHPFLGRRIHFNDLPPDCQKLAKADYIELWRLK